MTLNEKEWFIEAPWGRMCIVAWGHCYDPPVLLCHGANDSMASFRPLVKLLPKNFYYVGLEFPGNGKSDSFPPGLLVNFYDLVYSIQVVVKHFRWETFRLLAHSAGAYIGMLHNFCFPGTMSRIILLDPITPPVPPQYFDKWYKATYQAFFDNYEHYKMPQDQRPTYTRKEALNKLMKARQISETKAEESLERIAESDGNGMVRFTYDHRYKVIAYPPISPEQYKDHCLKTKAEILCLPHDISVNSGKYKYGPFLIDESLYRNDNYRVRTVPGHHDIHITHPERFATFISQFLLDGPKGLDTRAKL